MTRKFFLLARKFILVASKFSIAADNFIFSAKKYIVAKNKYFFIAKKYIVWVVMVFLLTVAVIVGTLFITTKADLDETRTALDGKIRELNEAKAAQVNTQSGLVDITSELDNTYKELAEISSELESAKDQIDEKTIALTAAEKVLNDTSAQLDAVKKELTAETKKNTTLDASNKKLSTDLITSNSTVASLAQSIKLYKETFGEVFSGKNPTYLVNDTKPIPWGIPMSGKVPSRPFNLVNNEEAMNPTYKELIKFLQIDMTDMNRYVKNYYVSGNYAETVHNNAEEAGIKTGIVFISFTRGEKRVINSFMTTDRGLVYIDCTGVELPVWANLDSIVNRLRINENYAPTYLFTTDFVVIPQNNPITKIEIYW